MEQQLLADDGRIRLDDEGLAVHAERSARSVGCRNPLRDDGIEGRQQARAAKLVLQAEVPRRTRDELADARHRPAAPSRLVLAGIELAKVVLPHPGWRTAPATALPAPLAPAGPSPARTSQGVAISRSAGSRSSRVVVVTNA